MEPEQNTIISTAHQSISIQNTDNEDNKTIRTSSSLQQCQICSKVFTKKSKLNRHINECHNNSYDYKCELCPNQYKRLNHLKRHLITHSTNPKPYICDYPDCLMNFTNKSHLNRHVQIKHQNHFYTCQQCGQQFSKKKYLNLHCLLNCSDYVKVAMEGNSSLQQSRKQKKESGKDQYVYQCYYKECGKIYSKKSNLKQHLINKHSQQQENEVHKQIENDINGQNNSDQQIVEVFISE